MHVKFFTTILAFVILLPSSALAHPGNTASDGCHYCRTNCDKWGEAWDERHCHGGYEAPATIYTPPKPRCPSNSTLVGDTCFCQTGYSAFKTSCIKIPANAHAITSATDAWECDYGYIEKGNGCVLKPVPTSSSAAPKSSKKSSSSISSSSQQYSSSSISTINQSINISSASSIPQQPAKKSFWNQFWSTIFGS